MTLPRSLDELRGLRAARWIRESTERQGDRWGPDAQREQQDRAIERYVLRSSDLEWAVAHSGRTIARSPEWTDMLERAGRDYDVLLVGYVSRFARDLRSAVNARHDLHAAGAAILFCDERVLSSDEDAWELWAREAVEAEAYSRRLGRRIREGFAAKFRAGDQAGNAPLGFRRAGPQRLLEVDPASIQRVVDLFNIYAGGTTSLAELAGQAGIREAALREILANSVYNGWVRRGREVRQAPWRADPPVDDATFARVQEVRRARWTGGGRPTPRSVHLLAGIAFCGACGARLRAETQTVRRRWEYRRYRHHARCEEWPRSTIRAHELEGPIEAQVSAMRLDAAWVARLRRLASSTAPPPDTTALRRRQLERELEDLAGRHARRRISTDAYLGAHARLTEQIDELHASSVSSQFDVDAAIAQARNLPRAWRQAAPEQRRALAAAIYDRVEMNVDGSLLVRLTPAAYAHGVDLAMSELVVEARPAGADAGRTTKVLIEFRAERLRAIRKTA